MWLLFKSVIYKPRAEGALDFFLGGGATGQRGAPAKAGEIVTKNCITAFS